MNLYNLAKSGLTAAQAGLETTSHNISNSTTTGYSRQKVVTSTAGAMATGSGYFGRGVQVDTVVRQYDSFLYRQLVNSQGTGAQLTEQYSQLSQVNNLFGDRTVGISPALSTFFSSLNSAASSPSDPAVRQDLLGSTQSLVSQLNSAYQQLETQREGLNTQISTTVQQVNSYLERINELNQQIVVAKGKTGQAPNDLLDQRDQAVSELNQLVGIRYYEQGDSINITLQSGQTLLSGTTVYPLEAVSSSSDIGRTVVAYTLPTGNGSSMSVQMDDAAVTGGTLGGLLAFRTESLDTVQDQLGQLAIGLAMAMNAQHEQGLDLNSEAGGALFGLSAPAAIPDTRNTGTGTLQAEYVDANAIQASDYRIEFDGVDYRVTRLSDNTVQTLTPDADDGSISFDGLTLTPGGVPAEGDTWTLRPTRDAARDITVLISDPAKLALADSDGGTSNGANGLAMAAIQTAKVLGNNAMSLTEAFSQLVNTVGVSTQQLKSSVDAQDSLISQNLTAQQSISGVNLNEEYVSLVQYQELYMANAKILDVASAVFDALLGIRS